LYYHDVRNKFKRLKEKWDRDKKNYDELERKSKNKRKH